LGNNRLTKGYSQTSSTHLNNFVGTFVVCNVFLQHSDSTRHLNEEKRLKEDAVEQQRVRVVLNNYLFLIEHVI